MKAHERRHVARKCRMALKWLKKQGYDGFVSGRLINYHSSLLASTHPERITTDMVRTTEQRLMDKVIIKKAHA